MKTLEILHDHKVAPKAWQLIEDPHCWCQGRKWITYTNRVARCAIGAIDEAYSEPMRQKAINRLFSTIGGTANDWRDRHSISCTVASWNNSHSHKEVLEVMKAVDI